jgi:hypothetical protein
LPKEWVQQLRRAGGRGREGQMLLEDLGHQMLVPRSRLLLHPRRSVSW